MADTEIRLLNPPVLPTLPGYSQVVVAQARELIVISGQVALDRDGHLVGRGDFAAQADQTFRNVMAALQAAGSGPANLIKLTTFLTDLSHLTTFREVRDRYLDATRPPASTLVGVTALFRPEFLIEIEALAVR